MTLISAAPQLTQRPAPTATQPVAKAAEKPPLASPKDDASSLLTYLNYGVGASGATASAIAIPAQVQKLAPLVGNTARASAFSSIALANMSSNALSRSVATARVFASVKVANGAAHATKVANALVQAPIVGRLFSPQVSGVMLNRVLPVVNTLGAGITVLDNANRYQQASSRHNTTGQVVAGTQIGLNIVGAVTGFMPGKAQVVSAVAGLGSLGLEIAHQAGGLGK